MGRPYRVLFLCTGNSARSILAEALLGRLGKDRFESYSAGSMPRGEVNPYALTLLAKMGYDPGLYRSKPWDEFARATNPGAPDLDLVITVCDNAAGEVCPLWPGGPMTAHWGLPDPAALEGPEDAIHAAFLETYNQLSDRIGRLVDLPIVTLDQAALRTRITQIGAGTP